MGSDKKPEWAVGPDGDTSKTPQVEAAKTLKDATVGRCRLTPP